MDQTLPTQQIVDDFRARGAELTQVEFKAAERGLPKSVRETLSAFANGDGGVIILGVANDGTTTAADVDGLRDALAGVAANEMNPPIRGPIEIDIIDGDHRVVRMDVPASDPADKPCFVTTRGKYGGSYIRGADGDRRLSNYEIDRLMENRAQPRFDREIVPEASVDDLDPSLLEPYLRRMRADKPRAYTGLDDRDAMLKLGVLGQSVSGDPSPTLAGLLAFGSDPQQFFPQLFISFVAFPTPAKGDLGPANERFVDNQSCEGPIGDMVDAAIHAVVRNLRHASVMEGIHRIERLDYPPEVIRELIVNAVMHRDYSPGARGSQIQVELYPDRLVVRSPGGIFGNVHPEEFGAPDVSSSRNERLARFLEAIPLPSSGSFIAENRGSGIPRVLNSLAHAGMAPPDFDADLRRVEVTVPHHALLTPQTLRWLEGLGQDGLTQQQVQALAMAREGRAVRNQTLQGWGLHSTDATRQLGDLVHRSLFDRVGERRGAYYVLRAGVGVSGTDAVTAGASVEPKANTSRDPMEQLIMDALRDGKARRMRELTEEYNVSRRPLLKAMNRLIDTGLVSGVGKPRSPHRRYRLAAHADRR